MRRFSIGRQMLLVAFVAANLAILRFLLSPTRGGQNWHYQLPAGLLPLADALLVTAYLLSGPKAPTGTRRFAWSFAAVVTLFLGAVLLSFFFAYDALAAALRSVSGPAEAAFNSVGVRVDMATPTDRYLVGPVFLAATLSAVPLGFAIAVAAVWSHFGPIITPKEEPCADS